MRGSLPEGVRIEQGRIDDIIAHGSSHDVFVSVVGNSHFHVPFMEVVKSVESVVITHDTRLVELYLALRGRGGAEQIMLRGKGKRSLEPPLDEQIDDMRLLESTAFWEVARRARMLIGHTPTAREFMAEDTGIPLRLLPFANYRRPEQAIVTDAMRRAARERLGLDDSMVHLGSFGFIDTRTKLSDVVLESAAWLTQWGHRVSLHLVGSAPGPIEADLLARAEEAGIAEFEITGFTSDDDFRDYVLGVDLGVQLRVSPLLGVSGPLSDMAAYGTPAVANRGLCTDVDTPDFIDRLPDDVSPVMVADAIERRLADPWSSTTVERMRVDYLRAEVARAVRGGAARDPARRRRDRRWCVMHVGIDIEQFVRDPYGSGIQRVLQYLAIEWPAGEVQADFVVPFEGHHGLLSPEQAAELLSIPFLPLEPGADLRELVWAWLAGANPIRVKDGDLLALYDAWLLPEVSYLSSVLTRFELFAKCVPTVMVGYDALPMTEPANYRFRPGTTARVSEYFRHLATTDSVVCISAYARDSILGRLRRDPALPISVAHPGGDHLGVREPRPPQRPVFARVGTLEARKRPLEILEAFGEAVAAGGLDAELLFVGGASASDEGINRAIRAEAAAGRVRWVEGASDDEVRDLIHGSSAFLSIGVEGYGIPVLEAIRLGTPVLFDGIQPAGDLMEGRGARRTAALGHEDLVDMFHTYSEPGALDALRTQLDPGSVPTWADFARGVVEAVRTA